MTGSDGIDRASTGNRGIPRVEVIHPVGAGFIYTAVLTPYTDWRLTSPCSVCATEKIRDNKHNAIPEHVSRHCHDGYEICAFQRCDDQTEVIQNRIVHIT